MQTDREEKKMAESDNYKDKISAVEMKEEKKIIPVRKQYSLNIPINYNRTRRVSFIQGVPEKTSS